MNEDIMSKGMNKDLPWSRVWITGAGRGIGEALAILCAQQGLTVYASSRTIAELAVCRTDARPS